MSHEQNAEQNHKMIGNISFTSVANLNI